ncbi:hypothetical protein ACPOL_1079 [Acidisarcina polymorpha]|uniref:Uncharacterized protein n=1 Tax=Acidisarcina polymorpha TaxID=2211140 RepID=A0A2Z5FUK9_9BACT|nr:hypothetical protein ACPOL_1079 [Acidisarcina polymorpha]
MWLEWENQLSMPTVEFPHFILAESTKRIAPGAVQFQDLAVDN